MKAYFNYYLSKYDITDIKISNVVVTHLYLLICKNMLVNTNDMIHSYNDSLNLIITGVFAVLYLRLFITSKIFRRIRIPVYIIILSAAVFIGVTYLIDPVRFVSDLLHYKYVKQQFRIFLAYSLPLFVVFGALRSVDCLLEKLFDFTIIPFIFATISFVFSLEENVEGSYMSYGNAVMFLCVVLVFKWNKTKNFWFLIQFAFGAIYIFLSGSRGALISSIFALFFILIINSGFYKRIVLGFLAIFTIFVLFFFFEDIVNLLNVIVKWFGIQSRTLDLLSRGMFLDDSGRNIYYEELLLSLSEHPIIGLGAFGGEASVGLAHSFYFDILANFGFIFGSIYIVFIFIRIAYCILMKKNTAYSETLLLLSLLIFPIGIIDMTFWGAKEIWMIMGLLLHKLNYISNKPFVYNTAFKKFKR